MIKWIATLFYKDTVFNLLYDFLRLDTIHLPLF